MTTLTSQRVRLVALTVTILAATLGCATASPPATPAPASTATPFPTPTIAPSPTPVETGLGLTRAQVVGLFPATGNWPYRFYDEVVVDGRPDVVEVYANLSRIDIIGPPNDIDAVVVSGVNYYVGDIIGGIARGRVIDIIDPAWKKEYEAWMMQHMQNVYLGAGNPALLPYTGPNQSPKSASASLVTACAAAPKPLSSLILSTT